MSKLGKPRLKRMRRIGSDLALTSGMRPLDSKCKINTRPGVHGAKRTRLSNYGVNLRSKQYIRYTYSILNKQLSRHYHAKALRQMRAARLHGKEIDYRLLILLDSRLDVVVWHMGFATTLVGARQLVTHKKVFVNGVRTNKPKYTVKPGSIIEVRTRSSEHNGIIQAALEIAAGRSSKNWLNISTQQTDGVFKGTFIREPTRDELPADLRDKESEVIQFYSK
jgi:small subunit ribosomal protein S4